MGYAQIRLKADSPLQKHVPVTQKPVGSQSPHSSLINLQHNLGNYAFGRMIQAKLKISDPGDIYEQEADRVAEQVMRMPAPKLSGQAGKEKREILQTKPNVPTGAEVSPGVESRINSLKGGGQPLSDNQKKFFEPRFGHDLSNVRVHTDRRADQLNQVLHARAFTVGPDIFFRQGEYLPGIPTGDKLLAHELTHTIQQAMIDSQVEANTIAIQNLHFDTPTPGCIGQRLSASAIAGVVQEPVVARQAAIIHQDPVTPSPPGRRSDYEFNFPFKREIDVFGIELGLELGLKGKLTLYQLPHRPEVHFKQLNIKVKGPDSSVSIEYEPGNVSVKAELIGVVGGVKTDTNDEESLLLSVDFAKLFMHRFLTTSTRAAMDTFVDLKAEIGWEIGTGGWSTFNLKKNWADFVIELGPLEIWGQKTGVGFGARFNIEQEYGDILRGGEKFTSTTTTGDVKTILYYGGAKIEFIDFSEEGSSRVTFAEALWLDRRFKVEALHRAFVDVGRRLDQFADSRAIAREINTISMSVYMELREGSGFTLPRPTETEPYQFFAYSPPRETQAWREAFGSLHTWAKDE